MKLILHCGVFLCALLCITAADETETIPLETADAPPSQESTEKSYLSTILDWIGWETAEVETDEDDVSNETDEMDDAEEEEEAIDSESADENEAPPLTTKSRLILWVFSALGGTLVLAFIALEINKRRHAIKLMNAVPKDPEIRIVTSVTTPYGKV